MRKNILEKMYQLVGAGIAVSGVVVLVTVYQPAQVQRHHFLKACESVRFRFLVAHIRNLAHVL